MEVELPLRDGVIRPVTLTTSTSSESRGGIVLLHGAQHGERNHPLYEATASALAASGLHVLTFDRRDTDDVLSLSQQTDDAHAWHTTSET